MFDGARVLDFGCGSGRDTKYFIEQGYHVEAIDGSEELCKRASELAGIEVKTFIFKILNIVTNLMVCGLAHHYCMFQQVS